MDSIERTNKKFEKCLEQMGAENLLSALEKSLGTDVLEPHLDYIIRTYEIY